MIALRQIRAPKVWEPQIARGWDAGNPPFSLLGEFTPAPDEVDHISVFIVDDEPAAAKVAAARCMIRGTGPARTVFAIATVEELKNVGLKLTKSPGDTFVPTIDDLHHDLAVTDQATLAAVGARFINTDCVIVEVPDVRAAVNAMTAAGEYDFSALAINKGRKEQRAICDSALVLVGAKHFALGPTA